MHYLTTPEERNSTSLMEQIERIKSMERRLEQVDAAIKRINDALDDYATAQQSLRELRDYLGSEQWRQDFADDEAGNLPADLKRGVLSEDGIWNALDDSRQINIRMLEMVTEALRQ